jgi:F-type H+-transporting ATPase subunit b
MTAHTAPAPTETTAHTEVAHGEHHGPTLLGLDAEGWVYTGVTIFLVIAFVFGKAHKKIIEGLDGRIADTKRELDEAAAVRAEAEALLADAKKQQAASTKNAKAILAQAEAEATEVVAKAEVAAKDLIARRTRMAEDKIAAAELAAVADVRAKAANAAAMAAEQLIVAGHDAKADRGLVDSAISALN